MRKTLLLSILILALTNLNAQIVEHYENPQRFEFSGFNNHNQINAYDNFGFDYTYYHSNLYLSRKYTVGPQRFIYGVAIPINTRDLFTHWTDPDSRDRFGDMINLYDTLGASVILGNESQVSGYEYMLVSTAHIRIGESAIIGNSFKMPDSDSLILMTNVFNST